MVDPLIAQLRHPMLSQRLPMRTDTLLTLLCAYWALTANRAFLSGARAALDFSGWQLMVFLLLLTLLHFLLFAPLVWRPWAKPMLAVLALVAGVSSYFTSSLGAVLDPAMLRNALHTDLPEARELLGSSLMLHLAVQVLPAWFLIAQVELTQQARLLRRFGAAALRWVLALLAVLALLGLSYQQLSSLMRNHKGLRYQVLPAAPLWSLPRSMIDVSKAALKPREPIGLDARAGPSWAGAERPRLLVWVVGETVRAANWGQRQLADGSARDTTPLLRAQTGLVHLPVMHSCGTDTETSLPCMFAPQGRRHYDEPHIRAQQSLLQVLARAGVGVTWIDNQSGCKGVCEGLETIQLECNGGRCLDDALFAQVADRLKKAKGTQLLVLHMLGNHGPAYFRRVPEGFAPYQPACQQDDLGRCSRKEIVNAFDNALRHSDELLAALWQQLQAAQGQVDTALLFTPDHGESLGEKGLFLHGLPYAIAPHEQTEVPVLFGIAPAWAEARGWSAECLAQIAQHPKPQHDHLFHTVLSLLDVRTKLQESAWDLLAPCKR